MNAVAKDARLERTAPFLRPNQIKELSEERRRLHETLHAPAYIRSQVQDAPAMLKRMKSIDAQLHTDTASPYPQAEIDGAVRRERSLREGFTSAMPTQAEMRRSPAGAIDKHRQWETKHKADVLEWKNVSLRLHACGMLDKHPDARDVANVEHHRPAYAGHALPMDNTLVPGKDIYLPSGTPAIHNVMDPEEAATRAVEKELIARMLRENPETTIAEFRDLMRDAGIVPPASAAKPKLNQAGGKK